MKIHQFLILGTALLLPACSSNDNVYDASGIFETTEIIVSAEVSGEIMSLNIEEGQELTPLTPVGNIDTTQLLLKKQQLTATRSSTESQLLNEEQQLAPLRQQIANQKRERVRYENLVKDNAATQKQLDDINYQIETLEKQLIAELERITVNNNSLQSQCQSIDAQLAQLENQIQNATISSPIRGTVLTKYAEPGEYASPGRALFKISDVKNMKLRAYITAPQLTELKLGQKVKVYADQGEEDRKEYEGVISWISDKAEFTPKTIQTRDERVNLVYAIKVEVMNDGLIKRGMYGEIKF